MPSRWLICWKVETPAVDRSAPLVRPEVAGVSSASMIPAAKRPKGQECRSIERAPIGVGGVVASVAVDMQRRLKDKPIGFS
jgi:hypothetical protein